MTVSNETGGEFDPTARPSAVDPAAGGGIGAAPPSPTSTTTSSSEGGGDSAAEMAKSHAADVAGTATEEAQSVVEDVKSKASSLLDETLSEASEQSRGQLQNLALRLEDLSDELDGMVEGSGKSGVMTDLARQLSERTRSLSSRLSDRGPDELLQDVRSFARQRPGTFLLGAVAAGVVAGRFTRGAKKAHDAPASPSTSSTSVNHGPAATPPPSPSMSGSAAATGSPGGVGVPTGGGDRA